MAYKTITLDIEAYELLRSRKRPGQSFSEVIRTGMRRGGTGRDLQAALARQQVSQETLNEIDRIVDSREAQSRLPEEL